MGSREGDAIRSPGEWERRRLGTVRSDLRRLSAWRREREGKEAKSTAPYGKPVWREWERYRRLPLAPAFSNRAPKGRKRAFRDAERLRRRFLAGELILSLVPGPEQRGWRTLTRRKSRGARHRVRLYSPEEDLLEEMRIKLSWVLRDLLGASGRRILHALAKGETDPKKLAARGEDRLKCTREQLVDALTGNPQATHLEMLARYLDQWEWVDQQMGKLSGLIAEALKPQPEAVARRAEVPGFGPHWAPPVIGEVGVRARTFPRPGTRPLG